MVTIRKFINVFTTLIDQKTGHMVAFADGENI